MADKGLNRLTVYKLAPQPLSAVNVPSYKPAAKGKATVQNREIPYRLLFYKKGPYRPPWLSTFQSLNLSLPEKEWPATTTSGFILLAQVGPSVYAVTGGVGHIHLRSKVPIEHRFGIELAQRMLSLATLRGLAQRDTSGVVNVIDRGFRARYNPRGDLNNLRRVLKNVRGAFGKRDPLHERIGSSIQASDALSVNGRKHFDDILEFLVEVEDVWTVAPRQLSIPQLEHINKKAQGPLMDDLEGQLITDLVAYDPDTSHAFFLDNAEMGYLPDRATTYRVATDGVVRDAASYQEVLGHARDLLSAEKPTARRKVFRKLSLRVEFEDGVSETRSLFYFLCGDVACNGNVYFLDNEEWYRASEEYIAALTKELDNIECIDPAKLGLIDWTHTEEALFNAAHGKLCVLDRHSVKITDEKGPIEFCDLLAREGGRIQLIHVKPETGAALRGLFAQGFVSADLYSNSDEFRDKVHTGQLQPDKGVAIGAEERAVLAGLKGRHLREITVVFAIYDNTASHTVPAGATLTSEVLKGTLSTFAKSDLLNRATDLRAMGYEVAVCRIRPYPAPTGKKK